MKKNNEYIIFACTFFNHSHYLTINEMGNIFIQLEGYFEILQELYNRQYKITRDFFKDILKQRGIDNYLVDEVLDSLDNEDDNFEHYLELYLKEYHKNKTENYFKSFKENEINIDELQNKIELNLINTKLSIDEKSFYSTYMEDDFDKPYEAVKIGREYFDKYENGFRKGELIVIAARTSIGKTSEMKKIALNCIMDNKEIGIVSLEMSRKRLGMDMLATVAGVSKRAYASGNLKPEEYQKINQLKKEFKHKAEKMHINYKRGLDIDSICGIIKRMVNNKKVEIVFIDYLQIINVYGMEKKEMRLQINYISSKLQTLAGNLNIPIVLLAQLSRAAEDRTHPQLRDLKESGKIEEDADVVILLSNEKWIDEDTKREVILRNTVAKNRNGATGTYYTKFNRVTGYIQDCSVNEAKADIVPEEIG